MPGGSAADEAKRAAGASRRLEGKARHAAKAADDWAKGAAGEQATAAALEPLTVTGWKVLHDLRAPDGGNIDHLVVGPPGVAVLDTKNWSEPVTITPDRRLVFSKYDHTQDLDRLEQVAEHIRSTLRADGVKVSVRGYLVLAGDADRNRPSQDVGDLRVLGIDRLAGRLGGARGDLDPDLVNAVTETLAQAFPPMSAPTSGVAATAPTASDDPYADLPPLPSPAFARAHKVYFLNPWKKGGNDRIYLNDPFGTTLGWTDLNTGAVSIDCGKDDQRFVETLLAAADRTGMKVSPGEVPKEPTKLFGGRLLSRFARLHTSLLVGQEWKAFGKHRLYGTLVDPGIATFDLGFVDLKTGDLHPSMAGPLHKDRREPAVYLNFLRNLRPTRS